MNFGVSRHCVISRVIKHEIKIVQMQNKNGRYNDFVCKKVRSVNYTLNFSQATCIQSENAMSNIFNG